MECETYGKVLSCKFKLDSEGVPIGYGYVQFETKEQAENCLNNLNGKIINDYNHLIKFYNKSRKIILIENSSHLLEHICIQKHASIDTWMF